MIIIIKNMLGSKIPIKDLGIELSPNEIRDLTSDFDDLTDIVSSLQLKQYVLNSSIVVNDGIKDLSMEDGIKHLSLETEYSDEDLSSVPTMPLPTMQIRSTIETPLTISFKDIPFDVLDFTSSLNIEKLNNTIRVLKSGLYSISYCAIIKPLYATSYVYSRVFKNNSDIIEPSLGSGRFFTNEAHSLFRTIVVELVENDFISLQLRSDSDSVVLANTIFSIFSLEGVKGEDGKDGRDGSVGGAIWLFGEYPPTMEQGLSGASYLQLNGNVYAYRKTNTYTVMLERENDDKYTLADAIKLVGPSNQEIVIDNLYDNFTSEGNWVQGSSSSSFNGTFLRSETINDKAYWNFTVNETGNWKVYAWWNYYNRVATNAPFTIESDSGSTIVRVNQNIDGNSWKYLTTLPFTYNEGWVLQGNIKGPRGDKGDPFKIDGYGDFNENVILTIENNNFDYVYAIQLDNRINTDYPIAGNLSSHIVIYYNGSWLDYGSLSVVQGLKGDPGEPGLPGVQGPPGPKGDPGENYTYAFLQVYDSNLPYNINNYTPVIILLDTIEITNTDYFNVSDNKVFFNIAGCYEISYKINWYSTFKEKMIKSFLRLNGNTYLSRGIDYNFSESYGSNKATVGIFVVAGSYLELFCVGSDRIGAANTIQNESYLIAKYIKGEG